MSKKQRKCFGWLSDNAGSALLTVIVFVAFMTVLGTILLYISGVNFQIKQNDYRNKKNFYSGEMALEEIRARLMDDASTAATKAYGRVMAQYSVLGNEGARTIAYNNYFAEELKVLWGYGTDGSIPDWKAKLQSYVSKDTTSLTRTTEGFKLELVKTDPSGVEIARPNNDVLHDVAAEDGYVIIRGIKITYINKDGYTSIINTDMIVKAPEFQWGLGDSCVDSMADVRVVTGVDGDGNDIVVSVPVNNEAGKNYYRAAADTVNIAQSVDYINWVKR